MTASRTSLLVGLLQIDTTVGDIDGNAAAILEAAARARARGAQLVVAPELALTGYPPQDLLFKRHFVTEQLDALHSRIAASICLPAIVGFVDRDHDGHLYNAAAVIENGRVGAVVRKTLLPTYDVFDEWRYFKPAQSNEPVEICGVSLGVAICEDIWDDGYDEKVVPKLAAAGARAIVNVSSSPFQCGKRAVRVELARRHALAHRIPIAYCNLVGAQDELIFDGESFAVDAHGNLIAIAPQFEESVLIVDLFAKAEPIEIPPAEHAREMFGALSLGVRDYFRKCGFSKAVIGLSGGIDSAVTACIAADALGAANVIGVAMPSRYTAEMSNDDAAELAANLGIEFRVLPIEDSIELAVKRYAGEFGEYRQAATVENLQARERGKVLMEISNDLNALVLATGNKTEYALGYSTLYGDMCGGLAVIGDVSKPDVYALARYINARGRGAMGAPDLDSAARAVIPARAITRAPSAELRENQVDPFDYDRISPLTDAVVEEHLSPDELVARGYSRDEIETVFKLVRLNEYKRRQAPPILRVTPKAFGIGRRMPIVNRYGW